MERNCHQPFIEPVAVVGAVVDQPFGELGEQSLFEGGFDEFWFHAEKRWSGARREEDYGRR